MDSYDGAEVCELAGLFLLNGLSNLIPNDDIGLYRHDGLAVLRNASGPNTERIKKKIIRFFKDHNLAIKTETGLHKQTSWM